MNKFTLAGILAWIVSGVLVGFQAIANLMKADVNVDADWKSIDLFGLVGQSRLSWVHDSDWLVYVFDLPLYILLFAVGLIFIVMGMIFWRS